MDRAIVSPKILFSNIILLGMPSKRELIGNIDPPDGLYYSTFQWYRIISFVAGIVTTILYLWVDWSVYLPDWIAAALSAPPVGLLLYGLTTSWTWRETSKLIFGLAVGSALATYI